MNLSFEKYMRNIGLHLRLDSTILAILEKAQRISLSCFQCFFIDQKTGRPTKIIQKLINTFAQHRKLYTGIPFVHASYSINIADPERLRHPILEREIKMANTLGFSHMVLHSGSTRKAGSKEKGIDAVARFFNSLFKKERHMKFILENSAHTAMSIGGDLHDFRLLLEKINQPERLLFCIDTAHLYSFGYDIATQKEQKKIISLLQSTIGFERIAVIHLNDTEEQCGSNHDKHAIFGEGQIGITALRSFAMDQRIAHIPLVIELPVLPESKEIAIINIIRSWHSTP